ncbi:MAG: hypothetical protein AAF317_13425 [Pseudomonadota bacterium]
MDTVPCRATGGVIACTVSSNIEGAFDFEATSCITSAVLLVASNCIAVEHRIDRIRVAGYVKVGHGPGEPGKFGGLGQFRQGADLATTQLRSRAPGQVAAAVLFLASYVASCPGAASIWRDIGWLVTA